MGSSCHALSLLASAHKGVSQMRVAHCLGPSSHPSLLVGLFHVLRSGLLERFPAMSCQQSLQRSLCSQPGPRTTSRCATWPAVSAHHVRGAASCLLGGTPGALIARSVEAVVCARSCTYHVSCHHCSMVLFKFCASWQFLKPLAFSNRRRTPGTTSF